MCRLSFLAWIASIWWMHSNCVTILHSFVMVYLWPWARKRYTGIYAMHSPNEHVQSYNRTIELEHMLFSSCFAMLLWCGIVHFFLLQSVFSPPASLSPSLYLLLYFFLLLFIYSSFSRMPTSKSAYNILAHDETDTHMHSVCALAFNIRVHVT